MIETVVMVILTLILGLALAIFYLATRIRRLEALEDARATLSPSAFQEIK